MTHRDRDLPPEVLKFLLDKDFLVYVEKYPKTEDLDDVRDIASRTALDVIEPYYKQLCININRGIFNFLVEPLKNANFYSGNDRDMIFGIYLTKRSIVASYNDGGEYFKDKTVKYSWENKIKHPQNLEWKVKGLGHGVGTQIIYGYADLIHVDDISGTLYTGILVSTIRR